MHTIVFTILIHVIHKNGSLESIMLQSIYGHICKLHIKKNICRIAVEIVFLFFDIKKIIFVNHPKIRKMDDIVITHQNCFFF